MPGFSSPPDPQFFNARVWEIVREVPPGRVTTYGQIAAMIPVPQGLNPPDYKAFAPRWVGGAMASCPPDVPWQRVINSQGKISERPGAGQQRELLEDEGVEFDDRGRVSLERYGWEGPPETWLRERELLPPPPLTKPKQGRLGIT